jgi:hypothetical protein
LARVFVGWLSDQPSVSGTATVIPARRATGLSMAIIAAPQPKHHHPIFRLDPAVRGEGHGAQWRSGNRAPPSRHGENPLSIAQRFGDPPQRLRGDGLRRFRVDSSIGGRPIDEHDGHDSALAGKPGRGLGSAGADRATASSAGSWFRIRCCRVCSSGSGSSPSSSITVWRARRYASSARLPADRSDRAQVPAARVAARGADCRRSGPRAAAPSRASIPVSSWAPMTTSRAANRRSSRATISQLRSNPRRREEGTPTS